MAVSEFMSSHKFFYEFIFSTGMESIIVVSKEVDWVTKEFRSWQYSYSNFVIRNKSDWMNRSLKEFLPILDMKELRSRLNFFITKKLQSILVVLLPLLPPRTRGCNWHVDISRKVTHFEIRLFVVSHIACQDILFVFPKTSKELVLGSTTGELCSSLIF